MSDDEFWSHGPSSVFLLLQRQRQRDNLHKLCAGTIAAANPWLKEVNAATFFPELIEPKTPEEIKEDAREQARLLKMRIEGKKKNARQRRLEDKRTKGTE